METNLVSIVTPCYNSEKYINKLLDSVLSQDYPRIEMIIIDDGSIDNTKDIVNSYSGSFRDKGYELKYIYQENQGQSAALNMGLKEVSGSYLVWPDSDDYFLSSKSISSFVDAFKKTNEGYAVIRCLPTYVNEKDHSTRRTLGLKKEYLDEKQFENCLLEKNFFWGAGNYMVKVSSLDEVIPGREIFSMRGAGQNWQILLPLLYQFKCLTLTESHFVIVERATSHSRQGERTMEDTLKKYRIHENTLIQTIMRMSFHDQSEKSHYLNVINRKYRITELRQAVNYKRKTEARESFHKLLRIQAKVPVKLFIKYCLLLVS